MKVTVVLFVIGALDTASKELVGRNWFGGIGSKNTSGDHPTYSTKDQPEY